MMPTYSIVIPVYNSTKVLEELVERIGQVFKEQVAASYEILMVDDCSTNQETWPTLERLTSRNPHVRAFQLMRNFGRHPALICGFQHARGEFVVTMDDDLQHLPEDLPKLIQKKNHDIVFGSFSRKSHNLQRRLASRVKGWFDYLLIGKPRHIHVSAYLLTNSRVVEAVLEIGTPKPFLPALFFFVSRDVVNVDVNHAPRVHGRSEYTLRRLLSQFSNLVIGNSAFLLRLVSVSGILVSVISFLFGSIIVLRKILVGIDVPGWTTIIVLTSVLQGLVLLGMGIVGEYLIRLVASSEHRPCYVLRRESSGQAGKS